MVATHAAKSISMHLYYERGDKVETKGLDETQKRTERRLDDEEEEKKGKREQYTHAGTCGDSLLWLLSAQMLD